MPLPFPVQTGRGRKRKADYCLEEFVLLWLAIGDEFGPSISIGFCAISADSYSEAFIPASLSRRKWRKSSRVNRPNEYNLEYFSDDFVK